MWCDIISQISQVEKLGINSTHEAWNKMKFRRVEEISAQEKDTNDDSDIFGSESNCLNPYD